MDSFQITFLGTGTSQGVPMIGCDCAVCTSRDPRDQRTRTSLLISTSEQHILIDTTPDLRTQCLREKIKKVDTVLFTHAHTDHIMGFDDLRRFCEINHEPIPIYASAETMQKIQESFRFVFEHNNQADANQTIKHYLRIQPHVITGPLLLNNLDITPIPLAHGAMTTSGFIFHYRGKKLLAYYTDCQEVPTEAIQAAAGAEILVLDALRDRFHPTHLNFEQAIAAAQRIQAKQTFFTHCCHDVSHAQKIEQLPAGITIAYDGLKIALEI